MKVDFKNNCLILILNTYMCLLACSQDTIRISNPSLEGLPKYGIVANNTYSIYDLDPIRDWFDVGKILFPNETGCDVHPNDIWGVSKTASEGNTYVGVVCRNNGSFEGIGQVLETELVVDRCYELAVDLATTTEYNNAFQIEEYPLDCQPAHLKIIGFLEVGEKEELLATSASIVSEEWQRHSFILAPKQTAASIRVVINSQSDPAENGNILIDNFSSIIEIPCK